MSPQNRSQDTQLLWLTLGFVAFGLAMLLSASGPLGFEKFGDTYWFFKHQLLFGLLPGLALFFIAMRVPATWLSRMSRVIFFFCIILLIAVLIPGLHSDFGTSKSWISILGFSFQPAEIMKLGLIVFLARWLGWRSDTGAIKDSAVTLFPFVGIMAAIMLLVALQPDVGTMAVLCAIAFCMFAASGASAKHLIVLFAGGVIVLLVLIRIAPYRAERFMTFLHPELDPEGIGYHINQAVLAVGSGGIFGQGFGHSRQKFQYLPEVAGDSIFAVMAEELGFIGTAAFVCLLAYFALRLLKVASASSDSFMRLFVVGVSSWIFIQASVNIGAMLGLAPLTGVPLPFLSYGGTSLVVLLFSMGAVLRISKTSGAM